MRKVTLNKSTRKAIAVHIAKPMIEGGGDGSRPLINWDITPYICNCLEMICTEGPVARGVRGIEDPKGERRGLSCPGAAFHGEWDLHDGHKTCVGKCPFLLKMW